MTQARPGAVRPAVAQLIWSSRPPSGRRPHRGRLPRVSRPEGGSCRRAGLDRSAGDRPRHCRPASRISTAGEPWPAAGLAGARHRRIVGTKAERRAAHERVSAYHQAQLAELLSHIGQRPAATVAARSTPMPWMRPSTTTTVPPQNCGSSASPAAAPHAEFIAGLLDRMTTRAKAIDWWERATPRRHQ